MSESRISLKEAKPLPSDRTVETLRTLGLVRAVFVWTKRTVTVRKGRTQRMRPGHERIFPVLQFDLPPTRPTKDNQLPS